MFSFAYSFGSYDILADKKKSSFAWTFRTFTILTGWLWLALIVFGLLLMTIPDSGGLTLTLMTRDGSGKVKLNNDEHD